MLSDKVTEASAALEAASTLIYGGEGEARYDLFHAPNSICSQKVRCVLAYHLLPYISHPVNLFRGETYFPAYVRLRMVGCAETGDALVAHHSGSTSAAQGCDGVVVPTLIDRSRGKVIVDSKRICVAIDHELPDAVRLRPDALADAIDEELAVVDHLPNYQILMSHLASKVGPETGRADMLGQFSQRKVAWCDAYLASNPNEPALTRAYTAKRAKELSAANALFAPDAMSLAHDKIEHALRSLETRLAGTASHWLFGSGFTMADLVWGIELLRLKDAGFAHLWEGESLPNVASFCLKITGHRAIQEGVLDWPGAMYGAQP